MSTIIIIAGGTASGKTSIAAEFAQKHKCLIIHHDRYYKDILFPPDANFDEPEALDNALLAEHLKELKAGNPVELPIYHFPTHRRLRDTERVEPRELIIVEGILTLAATAIAEQGDVHIFVDAPDDIRLARRLQRDVVERGRSVDGVIKQYLTTVRPMHLKHVLPSKSLAELILNGVVPIAQSVQQMEQHLYRMGTL
jgi:uridine kinase